MDEQCSPLFRAMVPGTFGGHSGNIGVAICEKPIGGLTQIAGWETFSNVLVETFGLTEALSYHRAHVAKDLIVFRVAPTRVQVHFTTPAELEQVADRIDSTQAGIVDLSHARCCLYLSGPDAENVLHRLAALDFSQSAFPVGDFRQSSIHHIATLFYRTGAQEFELFVPTTWAVSVFEYLYDAALSYGIAVETSQY